MRFDDDHPGLFTFLVGCVILVMAGVASSLLIDRRFGFSKGRMELQQEMDAGETELDRLQAAYQENAALINGNESKLRMAAANHDALLRQVRALDQRRTTLMADQQDLQTSIQAIKQEYLRYKEKHLAKAWAEAVGQSLGNLKVRGGREYHNAVIVEVDPVGLQISHEEGRARVPAADLDPALQDRFQWNEKERRAQLEQERLQQESVHSGLGATQNQPPNPAKPTRASRGWTEPTAAELEALRRRVSGWKSRVAQLTTESHDARSKAAFGRQVSVPGSLETWHNKASRLELELAKARSQLAVAKALLQEMEPASPLLQP